MNTKLQSLDDAAIAGVEASETEATATTITKPGGFTLDRFKTKRAAAIANVETLLTALPHLRIAQAKDFVRLHPNEDDYWSPELCFVNVPIKGQKHDTLHLIDEDSPYATCRARRFSASGWRWRRSPRYSSCPTSRHGTSTTRGTRPNRGLRAGEDAMGAGHQSDARRTSTATRSTCPRPRRLPTAEVADAAARRTDRATFAGRMIDREDHPGLLRLIGARQLPS